MNFKNICFICIFLVSVLSVHAAGKKAKKGKGARLPKVVNLQIPINDTFTLKLKLKENKDEIKNTEIVSEDRNGDMVSHPADKAEHTAIYKNGNYRAEFTITLFQNTTFRLMTYLGSFHYKKKEYNVLPADYNEEALGDKVEEERNFTIDGQLYKLSKLKPNKKLILENDELNGTFSSTSNETYADIFNAKNGGKTDEAQISNQYQGKQELLTEILILIDVSTYQKFLKFSKNDPSKALDHIKFHYTHIMSAVNDRYQGIKHAEFSWSMVVTALYIARTPAEAPFTTHASVKEGQNGLKGTASLVMMNDWVRKQIKIGRINWPSFDLILMFHDLLMGSVLGLAFVSGVCGALPVGLMRNLGTHDSIHTTTHEIGHLMGSEHDSKAECIPKDHYIMAPSILGDSDDYKNEYKFSPCTIENFARHIRNLNKAKQNCLLNKPSHLLKPMDSTTNLRTLPGQRYSLNEQCSLSYGKGSVYCGGDRTGDEICENIRCTFPKDNSCSWTRNYRPMDGLSCGNRKWCLNRRCVADANAPVFTPKKCQYGETSAIIPHHIVSLTCSSVRSHYKYLCLEEDIAKACCKTCEDIRDKSNPSCPYGDKEPRYCSLDHCGLYDDLSRCCETCKKNANGCYNWDNDQCSTWTWSCDQDYMKRNCCNKCAGGGKNPNQACKNSADWCDNYVTKYPSTCKKDNIKKTCCASCKGR